MGEKKLTEEEQEILDAFQKEDLRPATDAGAELEAATEVASTRSTRPVALTCE
tara:strand:- start:1809 stop:1967 length:159 start_codon:yes stop_codon:yes gene_type:complete